MGCLFRALVKVWRESLCIPLPKAQLVGEVVRRRWPRDEKCPKTQGARTSLWDKPVTHGPIHIQVSSAQPLKGSEGGGGPTEAHLSLGRAWGIRLPVCQTGLRPGSRGQGCPLPEKKGAQSHPLPEP